MTENHDTIFLQNGTVLGLKEPKLEIFGSGGILHKSDLYG